MSLRFLAKIAFICNIFFIVALILRYKLFIGQQDITSHVVLLGWLLAPVVNIIFVISWLIRKKNVPHNMALVIGIANIVFLLIQIYLYFILR